MNIQIKHCSEIAVLRVNLPLVIKKYQMHWPTINVENEIIEDRIQSRILVKIILLRVFYILSY